MQQHPSQKTPSIFAILSTAWQSLRGIKGKFWLWFLAFICAPGYPLLLFVNLPSLLSKLTQCRLNTLPYPVVQTSANSLPMMEHLHAATQIASQQLASYFFKVQFFHYLLTYIIAFLISGFLLSNLLREMYLYYQQKMQLTITVKSTFATLKNFLLAWWLIFTLYFIYMVTKTNYLLANPVWLLFADIILLITINFYFAETLCNEKQIKLNNAVKIFAKHWQQVIAIYFIGALIVFLSFFTIVGLIWTLPWFFMLHAVMYFTFTQSLTPQ